MKITIIMTKIKPSIRNQSMPLAIPICEKKYFWMKSVSVDSEERQEKDQDWNIVFRERESSRCVSAGHCTMCTCGTTIPLYPKLPCRGMTEFWRIIYYLYIINLVVATGEYLRENHEFRVWGSRKLKFPHVPPDWTKWDKYMLNGITNDKF